MLYIGEIDICIEFKMLKVKVPIIFFRHRGFLATWKGTLLLLMMDLLSTINDPRGSRERHNPNYTFISPALKSQPS